HHNPPQDRHTRSGVRAQDPRLIMKRRRTSIVGGLLLLLLVAFGLYWVLVPQPVLVETAEVVATTFQDTIEEDGRTRVRDRYLVSAPLSGRVQRMALEAGDAVK